MMSWNCDKDCLDTEVKTDYKMIAKELKKIVEEKNEEIKTLRKHLAYLEEETGNVPVSVDYRVEYEKFSEETTRLAIENSKLTKAVVNLASREVY